jgi:hypothetical protein
MKARTDAPNVLYHYTSLDVFLKIVSGAKLWASNYRYLNDASELGHFYEVLEARISRFEAKVSDAEYSALARLKTLIQTERRPSAFVASFSTKRDDLSQWRAYCPPGKGVCIGFKTKAVVASLDQFIYQTRYQSVRETGLSLEPVNYVDNEYEELDAWIATAYADPARLSDPSAAEATWRGLSYIAPSFKHAAFEDEDEWRIVVPHRPDSDRTRAIHFRSGSSTLIPYIEIDLASLGSEYLSEIIIGSSPNIELSIESAEEFLRLNKMDSVTVAASDVPYRPW